MKRAHKIGYIEEKHFENPNEELQFLLWKAELNKELMSFWRSISK